VDLARTLLVVSSRRLETVIGASSAIAGVLPVQGEVAVALRTPALLGLESAPEPQEGFVIFVSRRAAEPETATRIGLWVERLGEVERVEFAGDARPGESPGALRRRYVKSKSNEDCLHIEVDSIFDHPVFRESSKEN
jgi:chemotaxis signal transduction protein